MAINTTVIDESEKLILVFIPIVILVIFISAVIGAITKVLKR